MSQQTTRKRISTDWQLCPAVAALAENDEVAEAVLYLAAYIAGTLDPENLQAFWGPLLLLDQLGIYGARIWNLYEACGHKTSTVIGVLHATELGIISREALEAAIDHQGTGLKVDQALHALSEVRRSESIR